MTVERLTTSHEVGTVVNPLLHQGQIEGGIIQGVGMAVMEDLAMQDGRVIASHLGDFKLPTIADIPSLATELVGSTDGPGPFAAKAIGESSNILTAAAIANAVYRRMWRTCQRAADHRRKGLLCAERSKRNAPCVRLDAAAGVAQHGTIQSFLIENIGGVARD